MAVRLSNISSKTGKNVISIHNRGVTVGGTFREPLTPLHNKYTDKNIFDDSY